MFKNHLSASGSLPFVVWVVVASTLGAVFLNGVSVLGWNVSGLAWVFPLYVAAFAMIRYWGSISFPIYLWIPWIGLVLYHMVASDVPHALQRSIMLLCPIVVSVAVSGCRVRIPDAMLLTTVCKYMAGGVLGMIVFKSGLLWSGALPMHGGFAAEVMLAVLLGTVFVVLYVCGQPKALRWWIALQFIPFVALTRAALAVSLLTFPLTLAPVGFFRRTLIISLLALVGAGIFYTPRMQQRMFHSGQGTLSDLNFSNLNFATSGRAFIWGSMILEIRQRPWFGHGANASEPFVSRIAAGLAHPHNDWLRILFDYGIFGALVFMLCLSAQIIHAFLRARRSRGFVRFLYLVGASAFIPFTMLMMTDNVILYASFYGNMHFAILGLAYAADRTRMDERPSRQAADRNARRLGFPSVARCI